MMNMDNCQEIMEMKIRSKQPSMSIKSKINGSKSLFEKTNAGVVSDPRSSYLCICGLC